MIHELHIQNYRLFEDFKMEGLAKVNLIAGKNNTGKTALLEAVRIYSCLGDNTVMNNILFSRGQLTNGWDDSYDSMLTRPLQGMNGTSQKGFRINDFEVSRRDNDGRYFSKYDELGKRKDEILSSQVSPLNPRDEVVYIPFSTQDYPIQTLWEKVNLTPLKKEFIKVIRIIEPKIEDLDIQPKGARVLLSDEISPLPISNLGEGANRFLVISLALVTAKGKSLLIDEFESGLHHSVQEQLWEIIFEYAKKWDIQVFATTHSMDAVRTFLYVESKEEYKGMGKYFRLQQSRKGPIEAIAYDDEALRLAVDVNLEPR